MKRLMWLPIAGFLLVAGAAVAAAAPNVVDTAKSLLSGQLAGTAIEAAASPSPSIGDTQPGLHAHDAGSLLPEVLADLVGSGVITQDQSDKIVDALTTRAHERRAEIDAQREQMRVMWEQIEGFLEDGVISADEIAQLPADNPFASLSGILDDGQVTLEELHSLLGFGPFGGFDGHGRGHHGPAMFFDGPNANDNNSDDNGSGSRTDVAPSASPDSSNASSSSNT